MSKIISVGAALPSFRHEQKTILRFMERVYALPETDARKMRFLYHQGGIEARHSVLGDYSRPPAEWRFYPRSENLEPFPSLEQRMDWYRKHAPPLSVDAIRNCIAGRIRPEEITHLITVSCTGMSAPGLDLQVAALMDLPRDIFRTSINFMGCYAAIHAMKLAAAIADSTPRSRILIVCTELCTLHFQREPTPDNIMSSLLFADGSAAALLVSEDYDRPGPSLTLSGFYSEILHRGSRDMAWDLSSTGFQMTLSSYIPDLVGEDFPGLLDRALQKKGWTREDITDWCIHPGGRKILDSIAQSCHLAPGALDNSYRVLADYGNMSSPTILFVLRKILHGLATPPSQPISSTSSSRESLPESLPLPSQKLVFGAAFGPGLTMETFMAKA